MDDGADRTPATVGGDGLTNSERLLRNGRRRAALPRRVPLGPLTRISTAEAAPTIAAHRQTEPARLSKLVRGELDWIVMKCLEKERGRRYETVNGLAADLRRHLNTEPVVARPPSRWYEFLKTVRRHKIGFAATGAVILSLAIGLTLSLWTLTKEKQARERATAAELIGPSITSSVRPASSP